MGQLDIKGLECGVVLSFPKKTRRFSEFATTTTIDFGTGTTAVKLLRIFQSTKVSCSADLTWVVIAPEFQVLVSQSLGEFIYLFF